jgi:hypothetical protein
MTYQELDFIFPFFVLGYGALMTIALNIPAFAELAEKRLPQQLLQQMNAHRTLAVISLVIGALWSLQNIWFKGG